MDRIIPQDKRVGRFVSSPIRAIIEKYEIPATGGRISLSSAKNPLTAKFEED